MQIRRLYFSVNGKQYEIGGRGIFFCLRGGKRQKYELLFSFGKKLRQKEKGGREKEKGKGKAKGKEKRKEGRE